MPAAAAMAGIETPEKPRSANSRSAEARMRTRVAAPPEVRRGARALAAGGDPARSELSFPYGILSPLWQRQRAFQVNAHLLLGYAQVNDHSLDGRSHRMDRTYVVTGSASGIGAATAQWLARAGARVIGCDLHDADVIADLSTEAGRAALADGVARVSGGRVDGVIANAGGG